MKKAVLFLIFVLVVISTTLLVKIVSTLRHDVKIESAKKKLPPFKFYNLNQQPFYYYSATAKKPLCIIYYDTSCEFCQDEAKKLQAGRFLLKNIQIIMVSSNPPSFILQFKKDYKLDTWENIYWLYDKDKNFYQWFGHGTTPRVLIYDKNLVLVKQYQGEVKIDAIVKSLFNDKKG